MFQSFFNGVAGMLVFSRGLNTISDNVANLNTPGFRGSDVFYRSLGGQNSYAFGARLAGEGLRQQAGDIRETGNATDLAILGQGQFVISQDGQNFFTRGGQFFFDEDGMLRDTISDGLVMALGDNGQLIPIDISGLRTLNPEATTTVEFAGNLSTGDNEHVIDDFEVFNALGEQVELRFTFTNNSATTPGQWLISVQDENGLELTTAEVFFGPDGSPLDVSESVEIVIPGTANGSAGDALTLSLSFGANGSFTQATSFAGGAVSTLGAEATDGRGVEGIVAVSITEQGSLQLLYSNGDTEEPYRLALADIRNDRQLSQAANGLYALDASASMTYGYAGDGVLGTIASESLEASNVDLVREFAELIIAQRGYQASSHVMDVSNQLIETLYNATQR
ncbi:MAG: flagellar hook-basal body complex protein [Pseudomonadota bacterium]